MTASTQHPAAPVDGTAGTPLAASYARVNDGDRRRLDEQHALNLRRAEAEGFSIPDSPEFRFSDGLGDNSVARSQPELDRLVERIAGGDAPFERVYVSDRSRLGRRNAARQVAGFEIACEGSGVLIRYGSDVDRPADGEADPDAGIGLRMSAAVELATARVERIAMTHRSMLGVRALVVRGYWPAGGRVAFGLERRLVDSVTGTWVERMACVGLGRRLSSRYQFRLRWAEDGSVDVVREIFDRATAGDSPRAIARRLRECGVPAPTSRPALSAATRDACRSTHVSRILGNRIYTGDLVWPQEADKSGAVLARPSEFDLSARPLPALFCRDFCPGAPISREQFERVQHLLRRPGGVGGALPGG